MIRYFFYHSNCKEPGIVGIARVVKEGYPGFIAFEPKNKYYDPKSNPQNPRWHMVDIKLTRKLNRTIALHELKEDKKLVDMTLLRKRNHLSVMPVDKKHRDYIQKLD